MQIKQQYEQMREIRKKNEKHIDDRRFGINDNKRDQFKKVYCNNCKITILKFEAYKSIRNGKGYNVCKKCYERIG